MSEFRQYRLASQLFDRYNCLRDPNSYNSHLFGQKIKNNINRNDLENVALDLAQQSSDPTAFINHARFLNEAFPGQFENLICFLDAYNARIKNRPASIKSTPVKQQSSFNQQQAQQPETPGRFNAALDDIAKKLESATNKLGRPVTSSFPVPMESNDQDADFLTIQLVRNPNSTLNRLPVAVQELCVIEDLLFLVLNLDGKHFSFHHSESGLKHVIFVDESIDASILTRLKPVLKAAYCASRLGEFIQNQTRIGASAMMQALASSLDGVLKDFFQVVMALDKKFKTREIGLHQFCLHLSPFTRNLQSLLHLTFTIESGDVRGGALLRLLEEKVNVVSGDRQLKNTYSILLEGCARPFLAQLSFWLQNGSLSKDTTDFMIKSSGSQNSSQEDLHDSRYSLNLTCCPHLLEDLSAKVLNVGTYRHLQAILNKKERVERIAVADIDGGFRWDRRCLQEAINAAYQSVNSALMNSLFQSSKLFDAMCAAKRFFFVQSSDFINNFLSSATEELNRPAKDTSPHQLQLSLDAALKNSTLSTDAFAEAFKVEFASSSVYDGLVKIIQEKSSNSDSSNVNSGNANTQKSPKVVDVFNLNMKVDYPESLIMNSKSLAKYQLLFRHIFQCLELIRGLSVSLNNHQSSQRFPPAQMRQFEVMKSGMLQFVRTVHYYICFGVLQPHWERFACALKERRFTSIDEITDTHMDFLDTCLRECMLTNSKLVQLLSMAWGTCSKFSSLVADLNARISSGRPGALLTEAMFAEVMVKFSALHGHFCKYVRVLIEALQYYAARDCDHYIANFLSSLDCQYYS